MKKLYIMKRKFVIPAFRNFGDIYRLPYMVTNGQRGDIIHGTCEKFIHVPPIHICVNKKTKFEKQEKNHPQRIYNRNFAFIRQA